MNSAAEHPVKDTPMNPALPRTLLVNDDPIQLAILAELAQQAGLEPLPFTSAETALSYMTQNDPPSLIITDVNMPGIDGWRFCRLLKSPDHAAFNRIPILVISATFSGDSPDRIAAEIGADAFLSAPVDRHRFISQVEAILRGDRQLQPPRVLIVDDCGMLATLLKHAFSAEGYRVDASLTLQEATTAFAEVAYDLAIIDYHLPDGYGDSLLEQIHAQRPDCACIMMTGDIEPSLSVDWMKRGATAYIHKPFHPDYLLELCAKARREQSLMRLPALIEKKNQELHRSEEHVRKAEWLANTVLRSVPEGIIATDQETKRFVFANDYFCQMVGYTQEELLGMTSTDIPSAKDLPSVIAEIAKAPADSSQVGLHLSVRRKDGSVFLSNIRSQSIELEGRACRLSVFVDVTERKQAEDARMEMQDVLSLFMQHSPIYTYIKEVSATQSRVLMASENFQQMVGIPGSQMQNKTMEELFPPDFAAKISADDWAVITRGEVLKVDEELNGRYYITIKFPILKEGKTLLAGYTIDVTERQQAESALRQRESYLSAILENLPGLVWMKDAESHFLAVNKAFAVSCGQMNPNQVIDKTDLDIWPRHLAEKYQADDQRTMRSASSIIEEEPILVNGNARWFETFKKPVADDAGHIIGTTGYSRDITERKQAAEELKKSETLFRSITENAFDMISLLDMSGHYVYCNPSYPFSLGYEKNELLGRSAFDLVHPDDRPEIQRSFETARQNKIENHTFELRLLHKNGSIKWVNHRATLLYSADHVPMQILIMGTDVTAHKLEEEQKEKLEAQLLQAQKMESIGRLAGGVAHDFNNMLGVILGHAELALENTSSTQPIHADLQEIRKAAERSAGLTKQLLAFARKQTAAPKVLNLNETIDGMLTMVRRLIGEQIALKWQPGTDLGPVKMDPSQIDQILVNLCVNARDAIRGSGQILIETREMVFDEAACAGHVSMRPGEYVRLSVTDTGCGMDAETLAQIFEPFFTTKGVGKGTGLGLATVYGIVKQNHGLIEVDSAMGRGTTFHVYLPRHGIQPHPLVEKSAPVSQKSSAETILLVEDEPAILTMTQNMLQRQGYRVLAAGSSREALRLAQEHAGNVHLLVTDVVMPEMNGRDLARALLSQHPNLKRLFMSGHTADVLALHGMLDEGVLFIQKPFTRKILLDKILEALETQKPE